MGTAYRPLPILLTSGFWLLGLRGSSRVSIFFLYHVINDDLIQTKKGSFFRLPQPVNNEGGKWRRGKLWWGKRGCGQKRI